MFQHITPFLTSILNKSVCSVDIFQGILSEDPGGQSCFHNDIEIPFAFSIVLTLALLGKNNGGQSAVILA